MSQLYLTIRPPVYHGAFLRIRCKSAIVRLLIVKFFVHEVAF